MEKNYDSQVKRKNRIISNLLGVLFITCAISLFAYLLLKPIQNHMSLFIMLGVFILLLGYRAITINFSKIGNETQLSEFLKISSESSVDEFVNYKSNLGFSGFFKGIGITGLPLVTILITLTFCVLAILSYIINAITDKSIIPDEFPLLVLELSKLTLGAFIGSFVSQRKEKNRTANKK